MWLDILIYGSLTVCGVIAVSEILNSLERIQRKMRRYDIYFDLILEKLDIDAPSQMTDRIKRLALDPKRRIEAIALYREETGLSLREAAKAIGAFVAENRNQQQP